ncbi:MAG: hypothetical protein ACUVQV_05870 [Dissulfurimicrobium sp.]|uniref:hypothetical protein n=1 Tax=Dissulfurimicrobium sp. TaxID=2022436 RepID=UPI004049BDC2
MMPIGLLDEDGAEVDNSVNFPSGDVEVNEAEGVYEVPNPFSFWGATYILKSQADKLAEAPLGFRFKHEDSKTETSTLLDALLKGRLRDENGRYYSLTDLPRTLLLALAQTSRDPEILKTIALLSCSIVFGPDERPVGLHYVKGAACQVWPAIRDADMFDVVVNNPALPDSYKQAMVLIPGVQGPNPIVGEYGPVGNTHVWEYMRANSYIPWGHYASNMAQDSIRYSVSKLTYEDLVGLRALYYQRIYVQLAISLGLALPGDGIHFSSEDLEGLRSSVAAAIEKRVRSGDDIPFNAALWGWNYGFDFSPSGYRLHASHQQIHQQFALIPKEVDSVDGVGKVPTYAIGDQVARFTAHYRQYHGVPFFSAYINAIYSNKRPDRRTDLPSGLVIYDDDNVIVHAPKAQRSQGEVQIMARSTVGNIVEADESVRRSFDMAIYRVMKGFHCLGAEMVTCYEVSKRFDNPDTDQRLFYCFLPRHPQSPGAFSERQERWVTGHYPEDFVVAFKNVF